MKRELTLQVGDDSRREVTLFTTDAGVAEVARALYEESDEDGTVQADLAAKHLSSAHPEWHTTQSLYTALLCAGMEQEEDEE